MSNLTALFSELKHIKVEPTYVELDGDTKLIRVMGLDTICDMVDHLQLVGALLPLLSESDTDNRLALLLRVGANFGREIPAMLAKATGFDQAWITGLNYLEQLSLLMAVVEVNVDFFERARPVLQKLGLSATAVIQKLVQAKAA